MVQILLACALLIFGAEQVGMAPLGSGAACESQCPDDDDSGTCPITCSCPCCVHLPRVAPRAFSMIVIRNERPMVFVEGVVAPSCADHRPIFHVPKPSAA